MASPTRHDSDSSSTTGKRWRRPAALIAAFSASLLGLGALSQVAASPLAHAAGTATVSTWSDLRAAMSDTTVDTIDLSANVQRTAGATTAATDLPAFGRDLTIDGHGFSLDFRPGGVQTVIARSGILLTPSATASFTLKDINIIRPNGGAYSLVSYATTAASNIAGTAPVNNTQNWTVNFSDVSAPTSAGLAPSSGLVTLPGGTVNITDAVTWDSSNGTNPATVVVNARVVNVSGASTDVTFRNHSASGDTVGDMATLQANASGRTNAVNVSDGAHVTIENLGQGSTQAVNMDIGTTAGTNTQFNVSGAGTVLDVLGWGNGTGVTGGTLIMQAAPTTTGSSGFKITDGAVMNVHAQVPSNRNTGAYGMPALLQQVNGGLFLVDGEGTQLNVQADGAGNALAGAIRIRAVGNQTLEVSNLATLNVYRPLRNGGGNTAAAIRFGTATNNAFVVTSGGVVNVENDGNGNVATSDSSGNNGAVEFAANYWSFEVSGSGTWTTGPDAGQTRPSAVQLIAKNGAAVSAGGQNYGSIDMTDGSVFVANGNVNSTSNGIFGTGNNFSFTSDSPQYYDFANTNPRVGALVFDTVGAACTYTQTNSDIAVWGNGTSRVGGAANATNSSDNLIAGNPYMSWTLVDLALRGANFVTMASSSDASLDTTVGSFGTTGMSSWRRISGNNAPPTIRTMEAPTNADLYVRGTGTVAEGLIFSGRPIWDDEVFSRWQITDPHGNVTTSTAGQSSSVQSEDLYTTETGVKTLYGTVRYSDGNLLTTGTQYELTQAWRGSIDDPTSTKIHPSASTDILTNAVTVTDVLPPVPAVVLSPIAAILIGSGDVSVSGTWSNAAAQAAAQPNNPDPAVKLEAVLNTASNVIADCTAGLNSDGTWTCDLPDSVTSTLTTGDKVFFVLTDLLGNANPLVATPIHDTTMEPAPYLTASNANIVANDFTMTAHDATMVMSASNRDAQLIAAAHAEATHLGDAVEVTSVGIPNPATPGVYPVTFQISGAPADETNTVTVNATITENPFSYTNSTFTVDPTVSMADNSTWKVADGVQYYTGIFTAKDTYGGLISDLAVSDIVFTSSPQTNITGVVNHHDGTYTVQYSTTVADDGYTGSMTYKGTQVGVRLPIPFKAGPVCVSEAGDTCSSDPDLQTRVAVTVDWAAADDTATDEVTGYAYDKNGNPVDSAVFTIATTDTGLHLASPSTITTNQDGMGTLTATSATAGPHTATASINGTELTSHGSPLTLNFTAGEVEPGTLCTVEDTDNGSLNPTEWVVGQVYANPLSVSLADTPPLSTLTVLMADANCNPVEGAIVDMTANATPPETATPSATFNGNPATSDSDGFASATISDSASETVTIRGTYDASNATNNGVAGDYGSGNLWPSTDTPPTDVVSFTVDSVDTNALCVVRVDGVDYTVQSGQVYPYPFAQDATSTADPKMPLMSASLAAGGNQSVRTYLFDKACNPVPDYSVTFVGVPAMQPDGATPTTSTVQGTTDSGGMATGSVTDKKAETVNVGGTYASPDVPPSDTGSLSAAAITFTAGDADTCTVTGECQCADSADTATNLSVSAPSAHIPGTILATAHVTDRYCNVVADNFPVIFSVSTKPGQTPPAGTGTPFVGAGATVGTTNGVTVTTVNGNATATVSDSTPEFVNVSAAIITSMTSPPSLPVPIDKAPQTVEFTVGDVNSDSSFTCTPTSSSTETPTIPVANGTVATDNWTCVVHAVDNNNNPLLTLDVTKFNFAQSTNTANQTTPVVNSGGGDYTVKFYSKTADANNAVMATYNGVSVGDPATVVPIHFKADQVAPDTECPANGKTYKVAQVYADPNTIGVRGTASLTVLLADANCNPITGATVTYTTNLNAVIPGATTPATVNPATTNADGLAMSSVMDSTAETVTIGGTYDASNATSNGIVGNYGSGSLTSDTTSLGGTAPAPTGTSMVEFAAGDVAPDVECTVTVMPENISATVKVAQVYSGNAPWKADGTATDGSSSVYADGTSSVVLRTWLLDGDCNPVPGATATFAGTPSTPSVITPATAASADSTGMAKASITDTKAETVTVGGTYANTTTADHGNLASTTATFNSGAFDPTKSVFVVTPAVDPTSASKTNWVVADGTTPYSGYVAAYDAAGNPVTDMSATDFVYTVTGVPTGAPDVKVTIGAKSGNRYYVTFTTTYAAATYTVTAASVANPTAKVTGSNATDGTTVTTWSNGTAVAAGAGGAPIPFQAGAATGGGDTPIQCSDGRDKSWIGVSSPSQAAGTPATVTVHLTDINCNPVANASVSFTPTGNAKMTPAVATTDAQGVATSDVNNYTAQTVQITANSGAAVVGPVTTVFTAGDPAVDTDCTNNALYKQGTQLTVGSTMVQLSGTTPGSTSVDAFITDQYCNPITFDTSVAGAHGINVNLSVSPVLDGSGAAATTDSAYLNTAGTKNTTIVTDATGHATATLFDTTAETVNVKANLSASQLIKPVAGINVVFATGDFDSNDSSFTCVNTPGSAFPIPVANGTDSYTCTIDAMDNTGAALPNLGTGNFAFAVTSGTPGTTTNLVSHSTVTNNGNGTYTVKFTTLTSDSTYKVTASYAGQPITGGFTIVPTPIPFTFGAPIPPDPINPTCADSRYKTNTRAVPTTQEAGTPSVVTTLVTDKDCNPVVGTTVSWALSSTTASVDSPSRTTASDGTASTNLNDRVAEYVQVSAVANGAGATNLNAGSASVTFTAGPPVPGPVTNCPTVAMTGSNVTAASPITVGGTSTVTAKVTDANCNPVTTPVVVTFAITSPSGTATISTTPGSVTASTVNGIATARATNNTAETAKVAAQITQGYLYAPAGSASDSPSTHTQAPIVFQADVFNGGMSTFVCVLTPGSAMPPVADGVQSYTCTITAKDISGNGLTTTDPNYPINPASFEFAMSPFITPSTVTEVSATTAPGQYKVTFTTLKSDPNYTVSVTYNGIPIDAVPTVLPTPIPFQSGAPIPPDPNNPKCTSGPNTGAPKTFTYAAPTSTQVGDPYSMTVGSLITTYVTDAQCNPVVGATVAFTQDKSGTFTTTTTGSYTTNTNGMATAYETDKVAETTNITSKVAYTDPTSHVANEIRGDDGTTNVTFTAGSPVPEVPGTCPDGTQGHVNGTHLMATSPQEVTTNSRATAYITDQYCNPVGSVPVTFSVNQTTASLTGAATVNTVAGTAVTTFTDTKAEIASITAKIDIAGTATPIYASAPTDTGITSWTSTTAAPSRFTGGAVAPGICAVEVDGVLYTAISTQVYPYPFSPDPASTMSPKEPMKTANPTVGATQALRTYLFDSACNPLPNFPVTFADGTPAAQGPVQYTTTLGTTNSDGMATGTVSDTKAETVHAAGNYAALGNLLPAAITFKPGAPHDGPNYMCGSTHGTTLTASTFSTPVGTQSVIQAYVTDEFCNPVDGDSVTFAFTGTTGLTPPWYPNPTGAPTPAFPSSSTFVPAGSNTATTVAGYASVTITDLVAETINVRATGTYIGDVQVTFTPGVVDPTKSTLACVPTSSSTATPVTPVANGNTASDYYTCTITARDSNNNIVTDPSKVSPSDFTITPTAPSGGSVTVGTITTGATAGTFVSTLTSRVAKTDYTVKAFYNGTAVGAPDVVSVPFKPGPVDPDVICLVNGQQMKVGQIYAYDLTGASPTLYTSANVKSGVTEGLKVLMADKDCNPIPGVTLTITPNPATPVVFAMVINPTGADGMATATATDTKPEKVTFSGTYSSPANGSGNLWPGDVTWSPPAPTITGPSGTVVTDNPTISGTGSKEGDTITVKDGNGKVYCTATVGPAPDYKWSCSRTNSTTPSDPTSLPSTGTRTTPSVTATESDSAGNTSDPSAPKTITIDKTPATISGPADGSTVVTDTPTIKGGPGSAPYSPDPNNPTIVDVIMQDQNDPTKIIMVCTATVQSDGSWSCTPSPSTPLPKGDVTLTPVVKDATGGDNPGHPVTVTVNTTKPAINKPKPNTTVVVPRPPIEGTAPYSNDPTNPTTVIVTRPDPSDPTKTITVCGPVNVQPNGTWSCTPTSDLPSGSIALTPTVTDGAGYKLIGDPIDLTINTTPPTINPVSPSSNQSPTISGTAAAAGDKITVKDSNGATVCTATVAANHTWSCTPTSPLGFGTHNLTAQETDQSGNLGTPSAPVAVAVNAMVVQTGGVLATGLGTGAATGGLALAGVMVAIAAIRRREEAPAA